MWDAAPDSRKPQKKRGKGRWFVLHWPGQVCGYLARDGHYPSTAMVWYFPGATTRQTGPAHFERRGMNTAILAALRTDCGSSTKGCMHVATAPSRRNAPPPLPLQSDAAYGPFALKIIETCRQMAHVVYETSHAPRAYNRTTWLPERRGE